MSTCDNTKHLLHYLAYTPTTKVLAPDIFMLIVVIGVFVKQWYTIKNFYIVFKLQTLNLCWYSPSMAFFSF